MADEIIATQDTPKRQSFLWLNAAILLSGVGILFMVCSFTYGFFELSRMNVYLSHMVNVLNQKVTSDKDTIAELNTSIQDLQRNTQKSQELSAQQEQLVTELHAAQKGDMDKWYLAEAKYLIKMANAEMQVTHNVPNAIVLLQRADEALQNSQNDLALEIKKALATDLVRLQALPQLDVTDIYSRLSKVDQLIDQLTLPEATIKSDHAPTPTTADDHLPWWKAGLQKTLMGLRQIVVVRNLQTSAMPLVLPEEKIFLYQNLHAQIATAGWSLLNRNATIYQDSLARMGAWIQQYFDQNADSTKNIIQQIEELKKIEVAPQTVDLAATINLFDKKEETPPSQPAAQ